MQDFSNIPVGDEFQAEVPEIMSAFEREVYLSTAIVERPIPLVWINKPPKIKPNRDDNVDMNQSSKSKKRRLNLVAVPGIPSSSWDDLEVDSFVLGLYTFGTDFAKVKKFMNTKGIGDIQFFYYDKFYNSAKYKTWNQQCVFGEELYSDWRLHEMLSRLVPSIPDVSQKEMLVNVSKSFAERNITLEKYVIRVKVLVGLKLLVGAMGIGTETEDLTLLTAKPKNTHKWFTVSTKGALVSSTGDYTSLTSAEIIAKLSGSRLSKTLANDIFWEAVWPLLLNRGWHSEKLEDKGYLTCKDNIVFIVPDVKQFSRGEHVNEVHYFVSISDILSKIVSEPELLLEIQETALIVADNTSDQSDEVSSNSGIKVGSLQKVKDPSKGLIQHESKQRAETGDRSVTSSKRACMREENISRECPMLKDLQCDDTNRMMVCPESDHLSLFLVEGQNSTLEEMRQCKERCETVLSDTKHASNYLEPEQSVELPSISGSNINNQGTTLVLGLSEQQQEHDQQINADAPRRQSTRKRPMSNRALEALESSSPTKKRLKSTTETRKRERSTKKKHSAKACNRTQSLKIILKLSRKCI